MRRPRRSPQAHRRGQRKARACLLGAAHTRAACAAGVQEDANGGRTSQWCAPLPASHWCRSARSPLPIAFAPIRNLWRSTAGQEALGPEAYSSMSYYEKYAIWDWEKSRGDGGKAPPTHPASCAVCTWPASFAATHDAYLHPGGGGQKRYCAPLHQVVGQHDCRAAAARSHHAGTWVHRPRARVTRAVAVVPHGQHSSADDAVRQAELEAWLGPEVEDDPVQRYLPGDRVRVCAAWYSLQTVFGWGQSIKSCLRVGGSLVNQSLPPNLATDQPSARGRVLVLRAAFTTPSPSLFARPCVLGPCAGAKSPSPRAGASRICVRHSPPPPAPLAPCAVA